MSSMIFVCFLPLFVTGVQTLGGVYIRKMKITSREAASVTEMYSAASSQLTKTNAKAAMLSVDAGARVGIFGVGAGYVCCQVAFYSFRFQVLFIFFNMRLITYSYSFPSANNSSSISGASANGETKVKTSSAGTTDSSHEIDASFQSSVTCYGTHYTDTHQNHFQLHWIGIYLSSKFNNVCMFLSIQVQMLQLKIWCTSSSWVIMQHGQ